MGLDTLTVTVYRQVATGTEDHLGNPVMVDAEPEKVDGCLVHPGSTEDTDRPDGLTVDLTVHFPKSYTGSLRGCELGIPGWGRYRVVGDPKPFMPRNTPGTWNRPVTCEACDG